MKEEYDFTKDKTFDVYTIEELLEQYRDNDYYNLSKTENITKLCEEIERLNNNWNELKKYIKEEIKKWKEEEKIENDYSTRANILGYITSMENVQDKMEELKGVDKE